MTGKLLIQYMKKARYKTVGKARYDSFFPKQKKEKKKKKKMCIVQGLEVDILKCYQ